MRIPARFAVREDQPEQGRVGKGEPHVGPPGFRESRRAAAGGVVRCALGRAEDSQALVRQFGEQGLVDLTGVCGYYSMASMMQNINDTALPPGAALPMPGA